MPHVLVVINDRIIVVDEVGKVVPTMVAPREDNLLAIEWDGETGMLTYKGNKEPFTDHTIVDPWIELWQTTENVEPDPEFSS